MIIKSDYHCVVQAGTLTLPRANGDLDTETEFFVTFDAMVDWPDQRPYLLYRVNLQGEEPVHLVMRINGDTVVDFVVRDTKVQSFHDVFDGSTLRKGDNTLVIRVINDQPGTVVVSDVVVVFTVNYLVPTPDDDPPPPTGGPL